MGIVIRFPRRHARTSTGKRTAANDVSKSEVTPAVRAFSVAKIADQYSDGIQFRCHHLVTTPAVTPISEAIARRAPCASFGPHSSMTEQNEVISDIRTVLGRFVLKNNPPRSLDGVFSLGHTVRVANSDPKAQYLHGLVSRLKQARKLRGFSQAKMAAAIQIEQDEYKHYESPTAPRVFPPHLMEAFCLVCGVDPGWLVTGKGKMLAATDPRAA